MKQHLTVVSNSRALEPAGHYQQALIHHDMIYVSGQLGVSPADPKTLDAGILEQVHFALDQIETILKTVGCGLQDVVKATVYVTTIDDWNAANTAFAVRFGSWKPARAIVPCSALHYGALVEIDAIAAIR